MMTTYELVKNQAGARTYDENNALVQQKNIILNMVDANLLDAYRFLSFVAPLWRAMDYGYKVDEVKRRISDRAKERLEQLHRNAKRERKELEWIIGGCQAL